MFFKKTMFDLEQEVFVQRPAVKSDMAVYKPRGNGFKTWKQIDAFHLCSKKSQGGGFILNFIYGKRQNARKCVKMGTVFRDIHSYKKPVYRKCSKER